MHHNSHHSYEASSAFMSLRNRNIPRPSKSSHPPPAVTTMAPEQGRANTSSGSTSRRPNLGPVNRPLPNMHRANSLPNIHENPNFDYRETESAPGTAGSEYFNRQGTPCFENHLPHVNDHTADNWGNGNLPNAEANYDNQLAPVAPSMLNPTSAFEVASFFRRPV